MEWYREGRVPLIRCAPNIDYGCDAFTTFGHLRRQGLDLKGDILEHDRWPRTRRWPKATIRGRAATLLEALEKV